MNHLRYWRSWVVFAAVLCSCAMVASADVDDMLADFDFEATEDETSGSRGAALAAAAERRADTDVSNDDDDGTFTATYSDQAFVAPTIGSTGRTHNAFAAKELLIRHALQRATRHSAFKGKFAQLLPILRTLNQQQRLVLAALITAQTNPGQALNLQQVESMFGERRALLLPILFDIANLIKTASGSTRTARTATSSNSAAVIADKLPTAEFLKHSYIPLNTAADNANASIEVVPIESSLRDDRLQVDDTDDVLTTRNLVQVAAEGAQIVSQKRPEYTTTAASVPPAISTITTRRPEMPRSRQNDKRSYHERKLNMTAFSGAMVDQQAMESEGVPIQITLPRAPMNAMLSMQPMQPVDAQEMQLTLEQREELAFRDLNETSSAPGSVAALELAETDESEEPVMVRNETTGELLPMPEMLISRHRSKNNPFRKQLAAGTNGVDVPAGGAPTAGRQCDRFGSLCLRVEDYPMQAIMGSIRRHKHAMSALLAEYIDKDDIESTKALNEEAKRREDDELTPSGMCPSVIRYARPQKARSATGEWKYIVNTGQHTQTLRLEKCTKVDESCTYLTDNFRSRCVQVYNYHRLLSWDNARGLHIDIFKVPTCCSCHIDSYKEKFPPIISSYNGLQDDYRFSASNIQSQHQQHRNNPPNYHQQQSLGPTSPYTTILGSDEPQLDDAFVASSDNEDESIAYQYSNGFKRSPGKHSKYRDSSGSGTANKPLRYDKPRKSISSTSQTFGPISPTLDSYLTPPSSESEFDFVGPFKRGGTAGSTFIGGGNGGSNVDPIDIGSVSLVSPAGGINNGQNRRNRRPVRTNNRDQIIAGSDFLPEHSSVIHPIHASNTAYTSAAAGPASASSVSSSSAKRQPSGATASLSGTVSGVASGVSTTYGGAAGAGVQSQRPLYTATSTTTTTTRKQSPLPSISTASTSSVDLGKRVNYNYHPIIDFFGDALKTEKEIDDRVGSVGHNGGGGGDSTRAWRPVAGGGPATLVVRRRPSGR